MWWFANGAAARRWALDKEQKKPSSTDLLQETRVGHYDPEMKMQILENSLLDVFQWGNIISFENLKHSR